MPYTFQLPEPAHVPGYTGHVAGLENQFGRSFGQATHDALVDLDTPGSGRTVLTDYEKEGYDVAEFERKYKQVAYRTASWGDQKLKENMVVGYTGVVPRLRNHPGRAYPESCVKAISEFMDDQEYHRKKFAALDEEMKKQIPLKQVAPDMEPYDSPQMKTQHWRRPFYMENNESMKFQISGYAGFVPCTRDLPGVNFPVGTHVGLNKFHDRLKEHDGLRGTPVDLNKPEVVTVHTRKIFRENSGTVFGYSGTVPGNLYRFGHQYGHATWGARPRVPVLLGPNGEDPEARPPGSPCIDMPIGGRQVDKSGKDGDNCVKVEKKAGGDGKAKKESEGRVREEPVEGRLWQLGDDPYCVKRKPTASLKWGIDLKTGGMEKGADGKKKGGEGKKAGEGDKKTGEEKKK